MKWTKIGNKQATEKETSKTLVLQGLLRFNRKAEKMSNIEKLKKKEIPKLSIREIVDQEKLSV